MMRTAAFRFPLAMQPLLIRDMCEIVLGQKEPDACIVCHEPSDFHCGLCGLCWHTGCSALVANSIDEPGHDDEPGQGRGRLHAKCLLAW